MPILKILTIGGATQDITLCTKEGILMANPKDLLRQKLLGFELGAKINISEAAFTWGGGAANAAVNFANLGHAVTTLICVGQDALGKEIVINLKQHGIKTNLIQISEKPTGVSCLIKVRALAEEHVLFTYRGANEALEIDLDTLTQNKFDLIYLTSLSGRFAKNNLAKIFRYKNKFKKTIIAWNPGNQQIKLGLEGLKSYLKQTDVLIVNKDEATEICLAKQGLNKKIVNPRDLLKILAQHSPGIVVITDGEIGAYAVYQRQIYFEPALKIREKDTTGVGDAFGSTFAWALFYTDYNVTQSLRLAIKNAGAVLTQIGAQNGLLDKIELLRH